MSNSVIKVQNLSKRYRLGLKEKQADTLLGQISQAVRSPWDNLKKLRELNKFGLEDDSVFWALKDVSFEVKEGEVLGIIGKNGAGKSTLLKILSQITEPTSGDVEIYGRVASLLEVGTGFHPELSGRENIYMNGTILGMTRREIDSNLDEIIDFSGVEKFIDTPVKFYSSGMKVRLGFSVAAHLDPEILIIDEVLAVGDFEFQKKCLGKMEDVSRNQGRTVLFVSHQMDAIARLCSRVLVLKEGQIYYAGNPSTAIKKYLGKKEDEFGASAYFETNIDLKASILKVELFANSEPLNDSVDIKQEIEIKIIFEISEDDLIVSPGLNVHNEFGDHLFSSHHIGQMLEPKILSKGIYTTSVYLPSNFFSEGMIYFSVALMTYSPFNVIQHLEKIISLTVIDRMDGLSARGIYTGFFPGLVRPILRWSSVE